MSDPPTRSIPPDQPTADPQPTKSESPDPAPAPGSSLAGTVIQSPADAAFAAGMSSGDTDGMPSAVAGYELTGVLGRGGMGVVYKGRDTRLNRLVAVKMIQADGPADARNLIRFLAEAEAVAAVRHPHVVHIYEFGEHAGRPFIALELLPGGSLTDRLRGGRQFPPIDAAWLVARLGRGVEAAHAVGIVHRDLKPANVLFDAAGEPKVTDFGLAKKTGGAADLTRTQAVMGTPAYMAPEQAEGRGKFVGPPADVYALGVILYECLTGTVPFDGDSVMVVLRRVTDEEPEPPRKRRPDVPRDLELVCLKCLRKDPADRYPTAKELADDLERYVRGEPVSVRAAGLLERTYRLARRNPARAAAVLFGGVAIALAAVGLVLGVALTDASRARQQAESANTSLTDAKFALEKALHGETRAREEVAAALDTERGLKTRLEEALSGERAAKKQLEAIQFEKVRQDYFRSVDLAHRAVINGEPARAAAILEQCPRELRGWEWDHVRRKLDSTQLKLSGPADALLAARAMFGPADVARLEVSPVGPWVADGRGRVWDLRTGEEVNALEFTPPLAFTTDGRVWAVKTDPLAVADVRTGTRTRLAPLPKGFDSHGHISPDGRWSLARESSKYDAISVVETRTGKPVLTLKPDKPGEFFLPGTRFSPDGGLIAVASVGDRVEVWDITAGKRVAALTADNHTGRNPSLLFRPERRELLTAGGDGTVRVWDVATGAQRYSVNVGRGGGVTAAFSPDGTRVAACGPLGLILCDATTGAERWAVPPGGTHDGVVFSPDGSRLATWGGPTVRLLDTATGRTLRTLDGHPGRVKAAAFTTDGRVVSVSESGPVHVWDEHAAESLVALSWEKGRGPVGWDGSTVAAVDSTGRRIAVPGSVPTDPAKPGTTGYRNGVAVWDLIRGPVAAIVGTPSDPLWVAFTPGGDHLLFGSAHGRVSEWDLGTGKQVPTRYWVVSGSPTAAHPGRGLLAVLDERAGRVGVWDVSRVPERLVSSGRRFAPQDAQKELPPEQCPVLRGEFAAPGPNPLMVFSPDGGHLAVLSHGRPGTVWEVDAGRGWATAAFAVGIAHPFVAFSNSRPGIALGPGGGRIVIALGGELKVADTRSGAEAVTLSRRGEGDLFSPVFSHNGLTLYALTHAGIAVFESSPRPAFVPHRFETAPPPRPAR